MRRLVAMLLLALAQSAVHPAVAHDGKPRIAPAPTRIDATQTVARTATVDPRSRIAGTVIFPLESRVELTILGAATGELHLHGYDIEAKAVAGAPVIIAFDAAHAGRFPLVMHVEDELLGGGEKAVLYIEVRAP